MGAPWRLFQVVSLETLDIPALLLAGLVVRCGGGGPSQFALFTALFPPLAALFGFLIKGLGHAGGAAFAAQAFDDDLEMFRALGNGDGLSGLHILAGFGLAAIDLDLAAFDSGLGQAAGLEETGRPQPGVCLLYTSPSPRDS